MFRTQSKVTQFFITVTHTTNLSGDLSYPSHYTQHRKR